MFYIQEKLLFYLRDSYGRCQRERLRTACILEYSHVRLEARYE